MQRNEQFSAFCSRAVVLIAGMILLLLSIFSFSYISSTGDWEKISFLQISATKQLPGVLIWLAAFFGLYWLARIKDWQKAIRWIAIGITMAEAILLLVCSDAAPYADSMSCISAAEQASENLWAPFEVGGYLYNFPYQSGFVAMVEVLFQLFSSHKAVYSWLGGINAVSLFVMLLCLCEIARRLFGETVAMMMALFVAFSAPVALYVFFLYGNMPMCGLAYLSLWCTVLYLDTGKKRYMAAGAVSISLAMAIKSTALIMLLAIVIALVLKSIEQKNWKLFVVALVIMLAAGTPLKLIEQYYAARSGVPVNPGTSKLMYIAMGLDIQNDYVPFAPGWYNGLTGRAYADTGYDYDQMNQNAIELMKQNLAYARKHPDAVREFFVKKTVSQWNEPAFSLWWYIPKQRDIKCSTQFLENHRVQIDQILSCLQSTVYVTACVGCLALVRKKKVALTKMLLPLTFVGGFSYLVISEAKTQYAMLFYPLVLWLAAVGVTSILEYAHRKTSTCAA